MQTEESWKPLYSSSAEGTEDTDEDENKKIPAEALKNLDEVKNFIEVNGNDRLNMIFNELIENVEQMKLKNQKQSDIRSVLRP